MDEIISGFFGMIWALFGVIFQLAGPVLILIIVATIITALMKPLIRNFVDYIAGVNPRAEKQVTQEIKHYQQQSNTQNEQKHRKAIKNKINQLQNELKQEDQK